MFSNEEKKHSHTHKALFLSSSGGGGHLSSIDAILKTYPKENRPLLDIKNNWQRNYFLDFILWFKEFFLIKYIIKFIMNLFTIPELPNNKLFKEEIERLSKPYQNKQNIKREYIDVLLDICDDGFYQCAYWNIFQKQDDIKNIIYLINFLPYNENRNYSKIKKYIFNYLNDAYLNNCPYTEIVSTQPLGLSSICDAIEEYQKKYPQAPKVKLKQYLTDLPSEGCKHYFQGLKNLNRCQREKIELYMLPSDALFGLDDFNINFIPIENNPMVRGAFKTLNPEILNKDMSVQCLGMEEESRILAHEKIACIMLGSNASDATIQYVEELIKFQDIHKIFVFTGGNQALVESLKTLDQEKIVILGQQGAESIAQLMARSQYTIIRGGGLTIMEQLSLIKNLEAYELEQKQIFIHHHKGQNESNLTSGISWEDGNVDYFINACKNYGLAIQKTSPLLFKSQMSVNHPKSVRRIF